MPSSKLMSIEQVTRALDFTHATVQRVRLEILVLFTSARTGRSQMRVLTSVDPYERHCYHFCPRRGPLCTPQRDQQAAAVSTRTRIDLIIRSAACSGERNSPTITAAAILTGSAQVLHIPTMSTASTSMYEHTSNPPNRTCATLAHNLLDGQWLFRNTSARP